MIYVLFLFLFGAAGPHIEAALFDSLEECEAKRAEIPAMIAEHNLSTDTAKIDLFATACAKAEKAPQGKGV